MPNSTNTAPKWPFIAICIMLAAAIVVGFFSYPKHPLYQKDITELGGGYDFFYYYATTKALNHKISNIYASQEMLDYSRQLSGTHNWAITDNHVPPFYLLYISLANRTFSQGYYIHLWANLNLMWMSVLALCLAILPTRRQAYIIIILMIAATVSIGPAVDNIWLGQVGLAFTGLLAFTYMFDRADYGAPAGICLALSILLKMYPALLLVYFLLKKRWQTLKWTAYTLAALGLAAGLQWGFGHYAAYWNFLQQSMSYNSTIANQSLIAVMANVCPSVSPNELKIIHICLLALTVSGLVWMSRSMPNRAANVSQGLLEFSVWVTAATIASPISWSHHHILLALPMLAFLGLAISPSQEDATNAGEAGNEQKAAWSLNTGVTPLKRWLSLAGIAMILLLWCFEGETATNMHIKAIHYSFCVCHLGLVSLAAILAVEITALFK